MVGLTSEGYDTVRRPPCDLLRWCMRVLFAKTRNGPCFEAIRSESRVYWPIILSGYCRKTLVNIGIAHFLWRSVPDLY